MGGFMDRSQQMMPPYRDVEPAFKQIEQTRDNLVSAVEDLKLNIKERGERLSDLSEDQRADTAKLYELEVELRAYEAVVRRLRFGSLPS